MDLNFILSLNFDQASLKEEECLGIKVLLKGRSFNIHDNGKVSSGIFKHKQNERLIIVIYNDSISIGLLVVKQNYHDYIELARANICYDDLCRKIINMAVEKHTN